MNILDRARIERAVWSYNFWLDVRGVPRRRRRNLRRELRANLHDSAHRNGAADAVLALGGTRRMAGKAGALDPRRPHWNAGASAGLVAFAIVLVVELLVVFGWLDGAMATGSHSTVRGSLTLFPGSSLAWTEEGTGATMELSPGWACLAVGLVVFVAVARPWLLLTARSKTSLPT